MAPTVERQPADRFATTLQFAQALAVPGISTTPSGPRPVTASMPAAPNAQSVEVLPFVDMSPEKDQDYFTDGMAEEIINALSKIQALRVASRSSAFSFKGKSQDIRTVGEQLGVSTVLEGSARKAGSRLRLTASPSNVARG